MALRSARKHLPECISWNLKEVLESENNRWLVPPRCFMSLEVFNHCMKCTPVNVTRDSQCSNKIRCPLNKGFDNTRELYIQTWPTRNYQQLWYQNEIVFLGEVYHSRHVKWAKTVAGPLKIKHDVSTVFFRLSAALLHSLNSGEPWMQNLQNR